MTAPDIRPFTASDIPSAGALHAARHARHRLAFPWLPARFEDVAVSARAVEAVFSTKGAFGFAVGRDGRLVAYLVAQSSWPTWGRSGYVHLPGYGLAADEDPRLIMDLYALVGEEWNRRGCFNHYAYVSAADEAVIDAWFSMGFGRERADALLDLGGLPVRGPILEDGLEIRRAVQGDEPRLAELSELITRHQSRAPRWHPLPPEELPELAEGWAELATDPDWTVWLAIDDGETLGAVGFMDKPEADDDPCVPPKTVYLSVAAVKESARRRGIASILTRHGLAEARAAGFESCLTNWQTANLLAARTWPRFGFSTVAYRLARTINPMIAWARG